MQYACIITCLFVNVEMTQQLPFRQGDRVAFSTPQYRGTGIVVGMAPGNGFRNYAIVIEHHQLELLKPYLPFASFTTLVVDLYNPVDACCIGISVYTQPYVTLIKNSVNSQ